MNPIVSVIVPVYNVEPYLRRCVDSILNQTFKDFELILIDDGSPDKCPYICDEYAKLDSRVVVIHKKNGGLSSARNVGLDYVFAYSHSVYISFIDSDDYVSKDYLLDMYEAMKKDKNIQMVVSAYYIVKSGGLIIEGPAFLDEIFDNNDIFKKVFFDSGIHAYTNSGNKLYHKNVIGKNRFPLGKKHEDEYFANKIHKASFVVSSISKFNYYYREREDSIISQLGKVQSTLDTYDCFFQRYLINKKKKNYKNDPKYMRAAQEQLCWAYKYIKKNNKKKKISFFSFFLRASLFVIIPPFDKNTNKMRKLFIKLLLTKQNRL